jgi:hypothetical protein
MNTDSHASPQGNFSSHKIPFGLSMADDRLYEPRDVPLGKACNCLCPGCKQILYSKHCLSGKVAPHFAHAPGTECAKGYETALHLAAKQLIDERRTLAFPALKARVSLYDALMRWHDVTKEIIIAGVRNLESVTLEQAVGDIRPDLIVVSPTLGKILIEIAVTHFVDEEKLQKIREIGIPAVEFDLSGMRLMTFEDLRKVLFETPDTASWIYHPSVAAAEGELTAHLEPALFAALEAAQKLAEEARENDRIRAETVKQAAHALAVKTKEQERIWQQEAARLAQERRDMENIRRKRRHEELKRATVFKNYGEAAKVRVLQKRLAIQMLPDALKVKVRGAQSFGVKNPNVWQATLFGGLIHNQASEGHFFVKKEYAVSWLGFRFELTPEFTESESVAVWDYLSEMANRGALFKRERGFFQIAVASLQTFEALMSFNAGQVSLSSGLTWAEESSWPTSETARAIAVAYSNFPRLVGPWELLSRLLPCARERTPTEVCALHPASLLNANEVTKFLISAGFLVPAKPVPELT